MAGWPGFNATRVLVLLDRALFLFLLRNCGVETRAPSGDAPRFLDGERFTLFSKSRAPVGDARDLIFPWEYLYLPFLLQWLRCFPLIASLDQLRWMV